jgi:hypothetical protein
MTPVESVIHNVPNVERRYLERMSAMASARHTRLSLAVALRSAQARFDETPANAMPPEECRAE